MSHFHHVTARKVQMWLIWLKWKLIPCRWRNAPSCVDLFTFADYFPKLRCYILCNLMLFPWLINLAELLDSYIYKYIAYFKNPLALYTFENFCNQNHVIDLYQHDGTVRVPRAHWFEIPGLEKNREGNGLLDIRMRKRHAAVWDAESGCATDIMQIKEQN